jgi:hypothetical protein
VTVDLVRIVSSVSSSVTSIFTVTPSSACELPERRFLSRRERKKVIVRERG